MEADLAPGATLVNAEGGTGATSKDVDAVGWCWQRPRSRAATTVASCIHLITGPVSFERYDDFGFWNENATTARLQNKKSPARPFFLDCIKI